MLSYHFDPLTMSTPPVNSPVRIRPGKRHSIRQLLAMQIDLHALATDPNVSARDRAACARAWRDLEAMKREIQGKPRLAAVKVPSKTRRKSSSEALVRPLLSDQSEA